MSFNTSGYGGEEMTEAFVVHTNDPQRPLFELVVAGKVEKFMETRPANVLLKGKAGAQLAIEVEVLQHKDYPFRIVEIQTKRDDLVRSELVEQCNTGNNRRCVIRVENLSATPGRYAEIVTVHTDSPEKPSFPIFVVGIIKE